MRHPKTTDTRRARRATLVLLVLVTLVFGTFVAAPAHADTLRHRYLEILNHSRLRHDLRPLRLNLRLSDTAMVHTRRMIRRGRLFDVANLGDVLRPYSGFRHLGADVVGCGSTLSQMNRQMMGDAYHRKIILSPKLHYVGIGVIRVTGRSGCGLDKAWATAIFYG